MIRFYSIPFDGETHMFPDEELNQIKSALKNVKDEESVRKSMWGLLVVLMITMAIHTTYAIQEGQNEETEWAAVVRQLSLEDFERFSKAFPNSKHIKITGEIFPVLPEDAQNAGQSGVNIGIKGVIEKKNTSFEEFARYIKDGGDPKKFDWSQAKLMTVVTLELDSDGVLYLPSGRTISVRTAGSPGIAFQVLEDGSLKFISGTGLVIDEQKGQRSVFGVR